MELSKDGGKKWELLGTTTKNRYVLPELTDGKYHVRAVAVDGKKEADTACEYPVYVSRHPAHYPEGLKLRLDSNRVVLSWGQVLGTETYRLYRRKSGDKDFRKIYEGKATSFTDSRLQGVVPAYRLPGGLDNAKQTEVGLSYTNMPLLLSMAGERVTCLLWRIPIPLRGETGIRRPI